MIKKIIYINEAFYREHIDWGIDLLKKKGFYVELWSTLYIKYKNRLCIPKDNMKHMPVIYLKNKRDILKKLHQMNLNECIFLFVAATHTGGIEDFIRILIGVLGGRYCNLTMISVPIGDCCINKNYVFFKRHIQEKLKEIDTKIKRLIIHHYFPPTFSFVSTKSMFKYLEDYEIKKSIVIHTKDYDDYIITKREHKSITEEFIVFIDDDLANAEDFRKAGDNTLFRDGGIQYYNQLKILFQMLENYYGLEVIIAAHPKAEYKGNEFGNNKKIIYYQTNDLVRRAKLVLTHSSGAMSYIVLYKKPYIMLFNNDIKKHYIWSYIQYPMKKIFQAKCYNLDFCSSKKPWDYINYDEQIYKVYYDTYIKNKGTKKGLFFEVVSQYLNYLIYMQRQLFLLSKPHIFFMKKQLKNIKYIFIDSSI